MYLPKPPCAERYDLTLIEPPLRRLKRANNMVRPVAHDKYGEDPVKLFELPRVLLDNHPGPSVRWMGSVVVTIPASARRVDLHFEDGLCR